LAVTRHLKCSQPRRPGRDQKALWRDRPDPRQPSRRSHPSTQGRRVYTIERLSPPSPFPAAGRRGRSQLRQVSDGTSAAGQWARDTVRRDASQTHRGPGTDSSCERSFGHGGAAVAVTGRGRWALGWAFKVRVRHNNAQQATRASRSASLRLASRSRERLSADVGPHGARLVLFRWSSGPVI